MMIVGFRQGLLVAQVARTLRRGVFAMAAGSAVFAASVAPVSASGLASGTITSVVYTSGRVLFFTSGTRTAQPTCACCNRWEIDFTTAQAQSFVALLLTAYASGRNVTISGTGTCVGGANDTEGVAYIQSN